MLYLLFGHKGACAHTGRLQAPQGGVDGGDERTLLAVGMAGGDGHTANHTVQSLRLHSGGSRLSSSTGGVPVAKE